MMLRLARWTMNQRRRVVLGWIAVAIAITGISSSAGTKFAGDVALPGTGSQGAVDLLKQRFPAQSGDADQIVFHSKTGKLTNAGERRAVAGTIARVAALPHVTAVISPYDVRAKALSRDARTGFATVTFDQRANVLPKAAVDRVVTTAQSARSSALQVELGGQAVEQAQRASLGFATVVGLAAAILILLISFGSFTAMGLPIVTAVVGLAAGLGVTGLVSHVIDVPDFGSELALMIGLGVGVDYALFVVTRFREHYRTSGGNVDESVEAAMNTAGRAVLFAGVTVVIALLGMFALGVSLLAAAALATALSVALTMSAALTVLPALLSRVGARIGARARPSDARQAFWPRWAALVT